jgi:hypothetical protein
MTATRRLPTILAADIDRLFAADAGGHNRSALFYPTLSHSRPDPWRMIC